MTFIEGTNGLGRQAVLALSNYNLKGTLLRQSRRQESSVRHQ
jgi:hypothetical protein